MTEYSYVIKRLGSQETGSQKERGGAASRGRYMLISKEPPILSQFPVLSETQANDSDVIMLHPLDRQADTGVVCNWVFHNSKKEKEQSNGRDEFRIYFPRELDDQKMFRDDIVIFRRLEQTPKCHSYYFLWLSPEDEEYGSALQCQIQNSIGGKSENYAFYKGNIDFFEREVMRLSASKQAADTSTLAETSLIGIDTEPEVIIAKEVINRMTPAMAGFEDLFRDQSIFRDFVLKSYDNNCAVTRQVLAYGELNNVEAAHIHPHSHGGSYLPSNGIAMRRDIHWAFDKGFFTISDDLKIVIHDDILPLKNYLCAYHNCSLASVTYGPFSPDPVYLKYHRDHIFGLFKTQGVITALT